MSRRGLLGVLVAGAALAPAMPAGAASLTYVKAGNVYALDPEKPGTSVKLLDKKASIGGAAQADDGTFVVSGLAALSYTRFDRRGRQLGSHQLAIDNKQGYSDPAGPFSLDVSPDGRFVAYITTNTSLGSSFNPFTGLIEPRTQIDYGVGVRYATQAKWVGSSFRDSVRAPRWIDNRNLVNVNPPADEFDAGHQQNIPGRDTGGNAINWLQDPDTSDLDDPVTPRNGRLLAGVTSPAGQEVDLESPTYQSQLRLYALSAAPPNGKVESRCVVARPGGTGEVQRPDLSPDGRFLAWYDDRGLWLARTPGQPSGLADDANAPCTSRGSARLVARGGSYPDFGPAAVRPKRR